MQPKKFYQIVWFWLFIVAVILAVTGFIFYASEEHENDHLEDRLEVYEDDGKKLNVTPDDDAPQTMNRQNNKKYGLQKEATLKSLTNQKMYGLTLTSATTNFSRQGQNMTSIQNAQNQLSKTNGVELSFKYTNYGDSDDFEPDLDEFSVYQGNQNATVLDAHSAQTEVLRGQTSEVTFWVNLPKPVKNNGKIEIDYHNDDISNAVTFSTIVDQ